ncbi:MAG: hypothetical protein H0V82_02905 [Candidatus Protochlamydia sp.]|nr:hypothetical protein [Candidatus Protochlamydia sp.]
MTITNHQGSVILDHESEYTGNFKINLLKKIASIVLIIPGLIIGSAFKGLGYLSETVRELHFFTILHFTPVDHYLGSPEERLSLERIKNQLNQIRQNNFNQPTKNIVVYAEEGTVIDADPVFMELGPQKLIFVGINPIEYNPWYRWENVSVSGLSLDDRITRLEETFAYSKPTVEEALTENIHNGRRVYLVRS